MTGGKHHHNNTHNPPRLSVCTATQQNSFSADEEEEDIIHSNLLSQHCFETTFSKKDHPREDSKERACEYTDLRRPHYRTNAKRERASPPERRRQKRFPFPRLVNCKKKPTKLTNQDLPRYLLSTLPKSLNFFSLLGLRPPLPVLTRRRHHHEH